MWCCLIWFFFCEASVHTNAFHLEFVFLPAPLCFTHPLILFLCNPFHRSLNYLFFLVSVLLSPNTPAHPHPHNHTHTITPTQTHPHKHTHTHTLTLDLLHANKHNYTHAHHSLLYTHKHTFVNKHTHTHTQTHTNALNVHIIIISSVSIFSCLSQNLLPSKHD